MFNVSSFEINLYILSLVPLIGQSVALSWMEFTFIGGLIGLFIGIALNKPLMYLFFSFGGSHGNIFSRNAGDFMFLLMSIMPIVSPILGIGVGVSVSQSIFLTQLGIARDISWILITSFAHFIPTILYSALFHVPTLLNFAPGNSSILKKRIERGVSILIFVVWGSLIGLAQWLLIREHFSDSLLWFFLSALGISVGIFIGNFVYLFLVIIFGRGSVMGVFYSIGLIALLPYSLLTGMLLEFLVKRS
ncbi:hypothetical protein VF14_03720 [Nostoc linckia z18]|uniref:Uncharacterized protein n=2 Tax=Nostoc linckia TaxID=92942 RepID=A0A9Q6EI96_NOSLI|nr:hypothetical protein [Nostoc linckia]PHK39291.1 hypothetical protein VF12_14745 [Nostoc linckia z15]PHK45046.1 hypothetical protein VF13_18505 [Nostoc linckia z16]PHJ68669.1 hypothetical protein VF02_01980 [Nostoc linckia z1]PHJ70654.1 hypothetical protein VF05_09380 [Nostoc linckia z3]PHJ76088.1 hypothetical protein VF03_08230 [Nostoc linckia z2]